MSFTPFRRIVFSDPPPATVATPATVPAPFASGDPPSVATVASVAGPPAENTLSADLAERAALIEEGARVPQAWAAWFARLDPDRAPPGVSPAAWLAVIDGVGRTLDCWGIEAAALGWAPGELFGLSPGAPFLFVRAEIVALTPRSVTLRQGETLRVFPRGQPTAERRLAATYGNMGGSADERAGDLSKPVGFRERHERK